MLLSAPISYQVLKCKKFAKFIDWTTEAESVIPQFLSHHEEHEGNEGVAGGEMPGLQDPFVSPYFA